MTSHPYVRGVFSSAGFSPGASVCRRGQEKPEADEKLVIEACMGIGEAMAIISSEDPEAFSDEPVAQVFGIYKRPEPSFRGCFRPVGRAEPETSRMYTVPLVRQVFADDEKRAAARRIADKYSRQERLIAKG